MWIIMYIPINYTDNGYYWDWVLPASPSWLPQKHIQVDGGLLVSKSDAHKMQQSFKNDTYCHLC